MKGESLVVIFVILVSFEYGLLIEERIREADFIISSGKVVGRRLCFLRVGDILGYIFFLILCRGFRWTLR